MYTNSSSVLPLQQNHVLVTGASGGLGRAIACAYAAPSTHLTLWGRCAEALEATAILCKAQQASVSCQAVDLRDTHSLSSHIANLAKTTPIDTAFLCAGVSSGTTPDGNPEPWEDVARVFAVNTTGTAVMASILAHHMAEHSAEKMLKQIIVISSLAALYPLPSSPAYSASKKAIAYYAQALRKIYGKKLRISLVYPGYIDTPMSQRLHGVKPFCLTPEEAVQYIKKQLEKGHDTIIFPKLLAAGMLLLQCLPSRWANWWLRQFSFTVTPDADSPRSCTAPNQTK